MIQFLLLVSRQGKIRLSKWYSFLPRAQQIKIAQEAANLALSRNRKSCNFIEWREGKLIYKRYARSDTYCTRTDTHSKEKRRGNGKEEECEKERAGQSGSYNAILIHLSPFVLDIRFLSLRSLSHFIFSTIQSLALRSFLSSVSTLSLTPIRMTTNCWLLRSFTIMSKSWIAILAMCASWISSSIFTRHIIYSTRHSLPASCKRHQSRKYYMQPWHRICWLRPQPMPCKVDHSSVPNSSPIKPNTSTHILRPPSSSPQRLPPHRHTSRTPIRYNRCIIAGTLCIASCSRFASTVLNDLFIVQSCIHQAQTIRNETRTRLLIEWSYTVE